MIRPVGPIHRIASTVRPSRSLLPVAFRMLVLVVCGLFVAPGTLRADDSALFAAHEHDIQGLVRQVWPLSVSRCPSGERDLLVLSTVGGPPEQRKILTWMPCGSAFKPGDPRILTRPLDDAVVVVDVARVPGRSGPQLLGLSAQGLRIEALGSADPPLDLPIPGGLPLAPRAWEIGRIPIVDDWNDDGHSSALVPSLQGAWLIDLESHAMRRIEMPIYASYETYSPFLPATVLKWMIQEVTWPTIARADDDGDGRLDLFALSRWDLWIYHTGKQGLPDKPSRRLRYVPFDEVIERRHEETVNNYFVRDLDGDTRADLILSSLGGGLLNGHSKTRIYLNSGHGVSIDGPPDATRDTEGGFSGFNFVDIDGDGREEMIETSIQFGIVQMLRILTTRRAEVVMRVLELDPKAPSGTRTIFEDELSFHLDFAEARVTGLVPSLGDWNGDGVKDLCLARGDDEIGFRLGSRTPGKPLFGRLVGRQSVALANGQSRVADLDGDGLDDIVAFTDTDPDGPLIVLENLGRLPGTRPQLRAPAD